MSRRAAIALGSNLGFKPGSNLGSNLGSDLGAGAGSDRERNPKSDRRPRPGPGSGLGSVLGSVLGSGLGSGLGTGSDAVASAGSRGAQLWAAVERIRELGRVVAVSSFRDTAPMGVVDQPRFLNGALLLETEMEAPDLMTALLEIERAMGRVREGAVAKGPRVIDLDLLLYDDLVAATAELTVPHPAMGERRFVLDPMAEIAPEMVHPVLGKTMVTMLEELRDAEGGSGGP